VLGPIVRYGPNEYSIDDPSAAKIIYGHGTHFTKSSWYAGFQQNPLEPSLFTDRDPHHHAQERRKYQTTFSMSSLVTYEPYVDDCARIFCQRLDEMSKAGMALDMGHWFQCYAFDVIGDITFSRRFGFLDAGLDVGGVMGALQGNMVYSTLVGIYASLIPYIFPVMSKFRLSGAAGKAYLSAFIDQTIAKRKAEPNASIKEQDSAINQTEDGSGPQDFLSKWLAFHAEDPTRFTAYNVVVGMIANIVAGSDTTSTTLSGILYYLLKNPRTLAKLRDEINQFEKNGQISSPITFKESQAMPYLQAVIKEAQRLHPATGLPLPRVVPEGGATICGTFFPQGVSAIPYLTLIQ
jgi:cytochrome P450